VNLEKGTSTLRGLEDLKIEERLKRCIFGSAEEMNSQQRKASGTSADSQGDPDNDRSNDGYSINRDITAPGATLALGLMYIKSHNTSVASLLGLPATHYLLDFVRPDLLALRVISRSLILWNDVQPTGEWIDNQIPDIVKRSINFMKHKATSTRNSDSDDSFKDVSDFDPQAVRQANAFVIAGACFSLALRFAGSANRAAAAAIFERALYFIELRDNSDMTFQVQKPDTPTLVTCLCTTAISLAIVMAGTGDIDSFRLLRNLRWRCEETTLYGTHQAFAAAIGLLFLGGGKCTLGSSPQDVAILIAAFFPHFPVLSADNQYHLQALRHLYVLAAHERILEAIDIESGEKVCVPLELTLSGSNESIEVSTPYLLSNNAEFSEMSTKSDRYYPIVINATKWTEALPTLFVKRKPGHLSYLRDPSSLQSLSIQTEGESFLKSISLFSNDPVLLSFAKYFCSSNLSSGDEAFQLFCNVIAHESMKAETSEMIPCYLNLFKLLESCSCANLNVQNVWDVRLLQSYFERKKSCASTVNLLNLELIALVCQKVEELIVASEELSMIQGKRWWDGDGSNSLIASSLVWNEVPITKID
jgi:anaphase-promoting complex subunit 1